MRRTRFDIVIDIIKVVTQNGRCNKTKIVYGANLNFKIAEKYLVYLVDLEYLELELINGKTTYRATEKGKDLVRKFSEISEDMKP
ncbi:putative transcriptional regulator [Archaeoglobus sulfaticallidus PM70-1]|uniref:Putative transcriptional regulator n=1 Tax=Archaeoglobus sulfaticallidus PM70-1 TaxID=387631 RepID=N0BFW6_9EURY|nr:winged helix-turn-helix domain-containing protein [Archaeoglobus sulfaticallidus]AGK61918.1 putative transcriptional regulator [Archaeoglobus sulfaticallidus PM70-1]